MSKAKTQPEPAVHADGGPDHAHAEPTSGPVNFRIKHNGMGYPVDSVVPGHAFYPYPYRHIELGALEATGEECTVDPDLVPRADVLTLTDDRLLEENTKLKKLLGDLPEKMAEYRAEMKKLHEENDRLHAELSKYRDDLAHARSVDNVKKAEAEQRRFEEGARPLAQPQQPTPTFGPTPGTVPSGPAVPAPHAAGAVPTAGRPGHPHETLPHTGPGK